jgi:hypothetical protein
MKEALKLALEVLQWSKPHKDAVITHSEAITAIKEALAQPAPLPYIHSQWQEMIAGIPVTFESEADAKRFLAAQPAQEPDHGDELTIAYMSGVHRGKELAAQPVHVISEQEQLKQWIETTKYFTAKREYEPWCMKMNGCKTKCADCPDEPAQRPWVGLTEAQFLEATRLAENGNYLVAFVRIQEWLKEKNT